MDIVWTFVLKSANTYFIMFNYLACLSVHYAYCAIVYHICKQNWQLFKPINRSNMIVIANLYCKYNNINAKMSVNSDVLLIAIFEIVDAA